MPTNLGEIFRRRVSGEPDLDDDLDQEQFWEATESHEGRDSLDKWARRYDELDGAPEDEYDR